MSIVDDLVTWFRQQLDIDEQEIRRHPDGADDDLLGDGLRAEAEQNYPCSPYLRIAKVRALAEVEAKRRILDLCEEWNEPRLYDAICLLALPYAAQPGYREEEWRP